MSSMFKKRGGLAFKPKLPVARPRPTAPTSQPPKPAAAEAQITPPPSDVPSLTEIAQSETSVPETSSTGTPETSLEPVQGPAANHPAIATQPNPSPDLPPASESDDHPLASEHTAPPPHALPRQDTSETLPASTNQADDQRPQPVAEYATPSSTLQELVEVPAEAAITPGASEACETLQPTPPSSITRRKRTTAAATAEASDSTAVTAPRKRQRKTTQNEDDGATEAPARKPRRPRATTGEEGTRTPRRARSLTPEDAENQVVDLQKLKMSDLTRDLHIGKKFSRHDELRERERQARIKGKSRTESEGPEAEGEKVEANGSTSNSAGATPSNPALSAAPSQATAGPQFRIVDGQIVLDQSSLVMDRHARAVATQGEMEMVEENDFTRLITSSSFMNTSKLKGPNIWTAEETKLFYRGLAMFGTDFEMISKMFPGKQRRHVKLKYNREERHAPQLIHAATYGEKTTKMDLNEYKSLTGTVFESVESIEAGQRKMQEDFEAEQKRIADEQAEVMRKKREELFADDDKAEDGNAKKKKKRKTKQQHEDEGRYGEVVIEEDL